MQKEYRHIIKNFDLTYGEAKTLHDAEELIWQMLDMLSSSECSYDDDLHDMLNKAEEALCKLNPRLNVETTLDEKGE